MWHIGAWVLACVSLCVCVCTYTYAHVNEYTFVYDFLYVIHSVYVFVYRILVFMHERDRVHARESLFFARACKCNRFSESFDIALGPGPKHKHQGVVARCKYLS